MPDLRHVRRAWTQIDHPLTRLGLLLRAICGSDGGATRDACPSGDENHPGSWRPVLTLRSVDRDRGFLGERRLGRPVLGRWACWSPGFSVAAPATCPVALRARMR